LASAPKPSDRRSPSSELTKDLFKLRERRLERHLDDLQHWFGHAFSSHALFPAQIESPSHIARIRNHLRKKIRQRVDRLPQRDPESLANRRLVIAMFQFLSQFSSKPTHDAASAAHIRGQHPR
jgi:type II secretory pathway component PulJ